MKTAESQRYQQGYGADESPAVQTEKNHRESGVPTGRRMEIGVLAANSRWMMFVLQTGVGNPPEGRNLRF